VSILGNLCGFTASPEEAARTVIVIREAVALFIWVIHALLLAFLLVLDSVHPSNPRLSSGVVAFQLI